MSATYHLRGTSANMECVVIFLDSSSAAFNVHAQCTGQQLYEKVISHLDNLNAPARIHRELFGLQYKDSDDTNKWLKLSKKLRKQLGNGPDYILEFKVRFFLAMPQISLDRLSSKMYFLQIRTMLQQGMLKPRNNDAACIGALVAQLELGNWRDIYSEYHGPDYLHRIIIYPEQERKPDLLMRIAEAHQKLRGISDEEAERRLLEEVSKIDRYGIEIHYAKSIIDQHILDTFERPDTLIEVGVSSYRGITIFKNGIKEEKDLHWQLIDKIICNGKQFNLLFQAESGPLAHFKMSFNFSTLKSCKGCYDSCKEHHQFFQMDSSTGGATAVSCEFSIRPSNTVKRSLLKITHPKLKSSRGISARSPSFVSSYHTSDSNSVAGHSGASTSATSGALMNLNINPDSYDDDRGSYHGDPFHRTRSWEELGPEGYDYGMPSYTSPHSTGSLGTIDSDEGSVRSFAPRQHCASPQPPFRPHECNTSSKHYRTLQESMNDLDYLVDNDNTFPVEFELLEPFQIQFTDVESKRYENQLKNRYNDVVPYDRSRVILENYVDGDYINANHVVMIFPNQSRLNYIAAQGPLEETVDAFWQMIWEQKNSVIVMLTGLVEQGKPKCHRYWPPPHESMHCSDLLIENDTEECIEAYITTREVRISNLRRPSEDPRLIQILQYTTWPDHGCPADAMEFLQFISRVRDYRSNYLFDDQPLLVHCSAGIGRTGVLILMETACCLIEQNQPVEPMEMVRVIREQRPHMIQTREQFLFVCRAIVRFYNEFNMPSIACGSSTGL